MKRTKPGGSTASIKTIYIMALYSFFWKVWLRANLLTQDIENDYIAEVSTNKNTLRNDDIAARIVAEGSEIKYDTVRSILSQRDRIVRQALQEGSSVLDGVCQFTPRVTGTWIGANAKFDPVIHKTTLDIIPSNETRRSLEVVGVQVLGVKDSGAAIGLVIDTATGATDGTITVGDDIRIGGNKIKIAGTPDDDSEIGVYLINPTTRARTKVTRRLTMNDPKTIIARVPDGLAEGEYQLEIVTRYNGTTTTLLKSPRTITYERTLRIGEGEGGGGGGAVDPTA